jgi:opacity protein-like surface antigen
MAGYGFTDTGDHCSNCTVLSSVVGKLSTASTGGVFLGRVGFDASALNSATYGSWVAGLYGEGGYNDVYGGPGSIREHWNAGAGARLGFRWGNSMPYAIAGYTVTSATLQGVPAKGGQDLNGFKFGAGVETALGKNWALVVEATKSEYEPFRYSFVNGNTTSTLKADAQDFGIKAGVAYHF